MQVAVGTAVAFCRFRGGPHFWRQNPFVLSLALAPNRGKSCVNRDAWRTKLAGFCHFALLKAGVSRQGAKAQSDRRGGGSHGLPGAVFGRNQSLGTGGSGGSRGMAAHFWQGLNIAQAGQATRRRQMAGCRLRTNLGNFSKATLRAPRRPARCSNREFRATSELAEWTDSDGARTGGAAGRGSHAGKAGPIPAGNGGSGGGSDCQRTMGMSLTE